MEIVVKGIAASAGIAIGIARIVMPGDKNSDFAEEEILVTTITDPTMVHLMTKAAAIVTDSGGITSHPAILSREMGIPCVVNTKEGTTKIQTGMKIQVNGDTGEVYVLD